MTTHVYRDEDKLGRGEFYSYVSADGHILKNFGGFKTENEAAAVAVQWANTITKPVRNLECCCCGESTRGRQWWFRDTGYGICTKCISYVRGLGETEAEISQCYGIEGLHWGVDENAGLRQILGEALESKMTEMQWDLIRRFMLVCVRALLTPEYSRPFPRDLWEDLIALRVTLAGK